MNYQESREYIDKITREIPSVLGLDHMCELMKRLGNPQDDLKYVHIAGTNGKGSVIAFLYSVLSGAGYRIGRYVSPTLYSYREAGWKFREAGSAERTLLLILHRCLMLLLL